MNFGFLAGLFSGGGKSIVVQISFVMLIFLLFSDQILEGAKVSEEGQTVSGGGASPSCPLVEENQHLVIGYYLNISAVYPNLDQLSYTMKKKTCCFSDTKLIF